MVILGLDPGTSRIGYGIVLDGTPLKLLACGVLSVKSKEQGERLFEAVRHLRKLVRDHRPAIVALEKLFFVKNQKTGLQVSEMRGALLLALQEEGAFVVEYSPKEVKKSVTGDGNADKLAVAKMVKATIKEKDILGPDDITDAIAVALTGLYDIRNRIQ